MEMMLKCFHLHVLPTQLSLALRCFSSRPTCIQLLHMLHVNYVINKTAKPTADVILLFTHLRRLLVQGQAQLADCSAGCQSHKSTDMLSLIQRDNLSLFHAKKPHVRLKSVSCKLPSTLSHKSWLAHLISTLFQI